jgi:hypothetical protein
MFGVLAAGASGGDHGRHGQTAEDDCQGGAEMSAGTETLQRMMIQADIEAAYEALGAREYAAALMTLNGAQEKLKMLLEARETAKAAKTAEGKKQLTIDIQST